MAETYPDIDPLTGAPKQQLVDELTSKEEEEQPKKRRTLKKPPRGKKEEEKPERQVTIQPRGAALRTSRMKWKPKAKEHGRNFYKDPEIIKAMESVSCEHFSCSLEKGKSGKTIGYPIGMHGLPVLHCSYCRQEWSPVDLGLMSEEQAIKVIEELNNG